MKVRIIQLLCPARHCMMAVAYESATGEALPDKMQAFQESVKIGFGARVFNPWCGICRSHQLVYEDGATIFKTMEEAMPFLREMEKRQAWTRKFFEGGRN